MPLTHAIFLRDLAYVCIAARAGMDAGHVGREVFNATLVTSLLTILLNAWVTRVIPEWLGRSVAQASAPERA